VRVVVGLGNPGEKYTGTRHNAGFEVVDRLAARHGVGLRRDRRLNATAGRGRMAGAEVLLVEPESFMNLSGEVVRRALERSVDGPAPPDVTRLLVICDDYQLPLGTLRLRGSGSSGGHNGLEDVERSLGTRGYPRLRVGIGPPTTRDPKDFVLGRFRAAERETVGALFDRAADAVESWASVGLDRTMARYNGGPDGTDTGDAPGRTDG